MSKDGPDQPCLPTPPPRSVARNLSREEIKKLSATEREAYYESLQYCEKCGAKYTQSPVPCPDNKPGCLVAHMGSFCPRCGHAPHGPSIAQASYAKIREALGVGPDRDALRDALRDLVLAAERAWICGARLEFEQLDEACARARALLNMPPEAPR